MGFKPGTVPEQQFYVGSKEIGPTFLSEIEAYGGLIGQHWSYSEEGLEFFEDTPQSVIDGALAVYEAHDPSKPSHTEQP